MKMRILVLAYLCAITGAISAGCESCEAPTGACVVDFGGLLGETCSDDATQADCDMWGSIGRFYEGKTCAQLGFTRALLPNELPESIWARIDSCGCSKRAPGVRSIFGL